MRQTPPRVDPPPNLWETLPYCRRQNTSQFPSPWSLHDCIPLFLPPSHGLSLPPDSRPAASPGAPLQGMTRDASCNRQLRITQSSQELTVLSSCP